MKEKNNEKESNPLADKEMIWLNIRCSRGIINTNSLVDKKLRTISKLSKEQSEDNTKKKE